MRKAGAIMAISGGVVMTVGIIATVIELYDWGSDASNGDGNDTKSFNGVVVFFAGGAILLGSIPFNIAARHYKKKALKLSLQRQRIQGIQQAAVSWKFSPALTLSLGL